MKLRGHNISAQSALACHCILGMLVLMASGLGCEAADAPKGIAAKKKSARAEIQQKATAECKRVNVTGSLIKQPVNSKTGLPETVSPVVVIDRKQMERTGAATLLGYLARQPSIR